MRVAVFGAAGRMGSAVCEAVTGEPDLELVAAIDPRHAGAEVPGVPLDITASPDTAAGAAADVAVDFTRAAAARENAAWCARNGIHAVIGTSGLGDADHAELRRAFTRSNCLVAPNFAIGAVLMMRFAAAAAQHLQRAEIVELHAETKLDAPSGTARATAALLGGDVPIHSVRLPGLVAHQEVLFGGDGQLLTIRHDTFSREAFVPGVLLALERVRELPPGLTVGLEALL